MNVNKPPYSNSRAQIVINPNDFFTKPRIITAANIEWNWCMAV